MVAGCITETDYPKTWAPLAAGLESGCDSITGTYLNSGEATGGVKTKLTDWLFEPHTNVPDFQYLSITFDQNRHIVISGVHSPESTSAQLSNVEKYECKNDSLIFDLSAFNSVQNTIFFGSRKRRIYRSANYLVVESLESGFAIVMLIPVAGTETNWARFPMYEGKK
jgi:hypothetical protein